MRAFGLSHLILRNTGSLFIAGLMNKLLYILLVLLLARTLGMKGLGDYFFLFTLGGFLMGGSSLGLGGFVIRHFAAA